MATATSPRAATRPDFASRARSGPERRFVTREASRVASTDENIVAFRGHPIVYDEWTEIADWWESWQERIAPGAATRAIAEDDVRFVLNHDPNYVLARHRGAESDTLHLSEDASGVLVEADMDSRISYVRDLAISLERGDITGMSFAFEVLDESWDVRPDGMWLRTINEVRLYDVAAVTYPAYEGTDAGLRGLIPDVRGLRQWFESRKGRRNSAGDETILRSAVTTLRAQADDLEGLISDEADEPDEEASARSKALAADDAHRNSALANILGFARAAS